MNRLAGRILAILALMISSPAYGQNLCPNPGFEQLSGCPSGSGEINLAFPWTDAGSPSDLFSFCHVNGAVPGCNDVGVPINFAGSSAAHGGSAYAGFFTKKINANERTYVQAPLTASLANGQLYKVTAFFKRASHSKFATNRIGIAFSTNPLAQAGAQFIPLTPQAELTNVIADTTNWTPMTAFYNGTGLEDQLIIGNFRNDAATTAFSFTVSPPACSSLTNSAFYYVDDISITAITEQLNVTGDTLICIGESTSLTGITNTLGWWSLLSAPADTLPTINNILSVSPPATTTYLWNGVQSSYTVTVSVSVPPVVVLPTDSTICEGNAVILDATNPASTYIWSNGAATSQIAASDSGSYIVSVNNGFCIARDTFLLHVLASQEVNLGGSAVVCPDNSETVVLIAGTGLTFLWSPTGDTTGTITVSEPGFYEVVVTHSNGCTKSDSITVSELCRETLFIPGAFTPNNDGKNDLFFADGTNVFNYKIMIFNRWGQLVFNSTNLGKTGAWDGKFNQRPAPAGVYSYLISYDALQTNGKKKPETRSGYLILFR